MVVDFENLVANTNETTNRIGQVFWYMVSEGHTDKDVSIQAFRQSGLPDMYRFPSIRAVDAFKRASKSIEGKVSASEDERLELLVRPVGGHDKDEAIRHVVVEHRNLRGRSLSYDAKAAVLRFDHNYKVVDAQIESFDPYVVDAVKKFKTNFELFLGTYDGAAKRRVVRSVLNDLSASVLKESGGVYLVPRQNEGLLFQLISFINHLPNCKAYHLPVENSAEARDMVREMITGRAETTLTEIRSLLQADVVTETTVQQLLDRAKSVRREVMLYQEILRENIGTLEADADLLEAQMMNLIEQL